MQIRAARSEHASAISSLLGALLASGRRNAPTDTEFVLKHYIRHPERIACTLVFSKDDQLLGFQTLKRAVVGNRHETPEGWGIIGTHLSPNVAPQAVGCRLFGTTRMAAATAGLVDIEAFIDAEDDDVLAYYEKIGLGTWRTAPGVVCKRFSFA